MWGRRRTAALGTAALLVTAALSAAGGGKSHVVAAAGTPAPRAYVVAHNGRVQVLDTSDGEVVASANTGAWTTGAVVGPGGDRVYVVNGWAGVITAVDPGSGEVVGRIHAGAQLAQAVLRPDGKRLYVTGSGAVAVVDPERFRLVAAIKAGGQPQGIAITPDGRKLYVANAQDGTVSVIDTATASPLTTVDVADMPQHVAVSPDGDAVYVSSLDVGEGVGSVSAIDPRTDEVRWSASTGKGAAGAIAVSSDGRRVYVAQDRRVAFVDTATRTTKALRFKAKTLAVAPGDRRLFLSSGSTATVLDSADHRVLTTFQLSGLDDDGRGFAATAIAFEPPDPS
ncbi:YncE family protein [Saccharothrix sp. HUAS TT1]|uniref:YncE family protein n=1 Tax=unclassified Saccharothrix TaxID=2593673 RepID=UPI00345BD396